MFLSRFWPRVSKGTVHGFLCSKCCPFPLLVARSLSTFVSSLGKTAKPCDQFIMGLGTFKTHWQRQVQYFGHEQCSQYSCLIFDNRGMGGSDKPLARYSTTEMAKDTLELIDFIGWTSLRQLHIVGVSMGGMIAQELVCYLYSSHEDFDSFSISI